MRRLYRGTKCFTDGQRQDYRDHSPPSYCDKRVRNQFDKILVLLETANCWKGVMQQLQLRVLSNKIMKRFLFKFTLIFTLSLIILTLSGQDLFP